MTDAVNEQLSACLDGELPPAELDLLLKRLERNPELREAIGRYTVIGEALRHSRPAVASRSFAAMGPWVTPARWTEKIASAATVAAMPIPATGRRLRARIGETRMLRRAAAGSCSTAAITLSANDREATAGRV